MKRFKNLNTLRLSIKRASLLLPAPMFERPERSGRTAAHSEDLRRFGYQFMVLP
jgi:hypothetical protein